MKNKFKTCKELDKTRQNDLYIFKSNALINEKPRLLLAFERAVSYNEVQYV